LSLSNFLSKLAAFSCRNYKWIIIISLILSILCAINLRKLTLDTDVLNLMPMSSEYTRTFKEIYKDFGSLDQILVTVFVPANRNWTDYADFVKNLSELLQKKSTIKGVDYKIPDIYSFFKAMLNKGVLFLNENEFKTLEEKLSDDAIKKQIQKDKLLLSSTPSSFIQKKIINDPLDLFSIFSQRFKDKEQFLTMDIKKGFFLSKDDSSFAIIVKPAKNPQDIKFDKAFAKDLNDSIKSALESLPKDIVKPEVLSYGGHLIALAESESIHKDLLMNIYTSAIGVLILFFITFRNPFSLILAFYPLAVSILLTFGILSLVNVKMSAASSGFTAILIGLGIDFVVITYNRYIYERKKGKNHVNACMIMLGTVGISVIIGAITTSASFFTLLTTDFKGLSQLGFLSGCGILIALITTFLVLPALLTLNDKLFKTKNITDIYIHRLTDLSMKFPKFTLITVLVLVLFFIYQLPKLTFDDDFMKLRAKKKELEYAKGKIEEKFMRSTNHMTILVEGKDDVLELNQKVYEVLSKAKSEREIGGLDSIQLYLNPVKDQKRILTALKEDKTGKFDFTRIKNTFLAALDKNKFNKQGFIPFLETLQKALAPKSLLTIKDLDVVRFEQLFSKYIRKIGDRYKVATYVYPNPGEWRTSAPQWFLDQIKGIDKNVRITGTNLASQATRMIIKKDGLKACVLAFIIVTLLLFINLRNLKSMFMTLLPLVVGFIFMFGAMALLSKPLNLINIFSAALVLGIGVDYGVHIYLRFTEEKDVDREDILAQSKAITIAALTTINGFSSLAFSSNPGLASLGFMITLGVVSTWIASMTVVPAIFTLMKRS
jgi:uncharacterized protein